MPAELTLRICQAEDRLYSDKFRHILECYRRALQATRVSMNGILGVCSLRVSDVWAQELPELVPDPDQVICQGLTSSVSQGIETVAVSMKHDSVCI